MITSRKNPLIKQIRRLQRSKRAREEAGLFIVEGIQGVVEAVKSGATLTTLVYAPDLLTSQIALETIESAKAAGKACQEVSKALFEKISTRQNPVGILAIVARQLTTLDELLVTPDTLYVALFEVSDPGNLGTILRTIDAVGGSGVLLIGQTVDPFHPTTVKASASTIFSVPIVQLAQLETLLAWCEEKQITIIGTSDQAKELYWSPTYATSSPILLLMGSEAHGLPPATLRNLAQIVSIPMLGSADSLNLGVATALLLYEVRRQRGT